MEFGRVQKLRKAIGVVDKVNEALGIDMFIPQLDLDKERDVLGITKFTKVVTNNHILVTRKLCTVGNPRDDLLNVGVRVVGGGGEGIGEDNTDMAGLELVDNDLNWDLVQITQLVGIDIIHRVVIGDCGWVDINVKIKEPDEENVNVVDAVFRMG